MKRHLGIDGIQRQWADALLWCLQVLAIVAMVGVFCLAFGFLSVSRVLGQQAHGWQLGVCVDDQFRLTTCRLLGSPLPDEEICRTLRASIAPRLVAGRVH